MSLLKGGKLRLRNPRSATFAEYAVGHLRRIVGDEILVDINEHTIKHTVHSWKEEIATMWRFTRNITERLSHQDGSPSTPSLWLPLPPLSA
jgi:hypothetical protein